MKNKIYYVEWKDNWTIPCSTIVKAKDKEHAWRKVKRKHPFTTNYVVCIREI